VPGPPDTDDAIAPIELAGLTAKDPRNSVIVTSLIVGSGKRMAYEQIQIHEIIDRAVNHSWSIPEFQRGFVWQATQVRDLAESLWYDYPIGSLLVWNSKGPTEEQGAHDSKHPSLWVVDGQQRTTALCILSGRKPYWWSSGDEWNQTLKRFDIRFDVHAKEPPFFRVADAVIRKAPGSRFIRLCELLVLDTSHEIDLKILQNLAKKIKQEGLCDGIDAMEIYTRLDSSSTPQFWK
jgi:hypothetical protein